MSGIPPKEQATRDRADRNALIIATVTATLREAAEWGPMERDDLRSIADEVEWLHPNDLCCPVCDEMTCDECCPLAEVRRGVNA